MCTSSSCDSRFNVIAGLTCYNNYFKWDGGFTGLVIFDLLCNILLSVINLNNLLGPRSVWLFHIDYSQLSLKLIYTDTMTLNIKLKIKFISHTNKLSVFVFAKNATFVVVLKVITWVSLWMFRRVCDHCVCFHMKVIFCILMFTLF